MENSIGASQFEFDNFGWRYFNKIRKKAMEQEFSWSGLLLSMSIAFFIVIIAAVCLNFLYDSIQTAGKQGVRKNNIYILENTAQYLEVNAIGEYKLENLRTLYFT